MPRGLEVAIADPAPTGGPGGTVDARSRWRQAARAIGNVQAWVILTLFYVTILAPIGLLFRLRRADPLRIRRPGGWHPLPAPYDSPEEAGRQS
jgi:hypothetical protein